MVGRTSASHAPLRLRIYAVLELVVAVSALLLPLALARVGARARMGLRRRRRAGTVRVVRVAISLALLGIPAAAMGATFPIAADWYARSAADTGVALRGEHRRRRARRDRRRLLPDPGARPARDHLGRRRAEPRRRRRRVVARDAATRQPPRHAEPAEHRVVKKSKKSLCASQRSPRFDVWSLAISGAACCACAAAALSGFAALVYEVAWTRLLALVIGPTTYAFATMAAAFIGGLAIGSALGTRLARRVGAPAVWLAAMLVAVGDRRQRRRLVRRDAHAARRRRAGRRSGRRLHAAWSLTQALGVGAAAAADDARARRDISARARRRRRAARRRTGGRDAARVYTANTLGAIAGALAAGFVLIPRARPAT